MEEGINTDNNAPPITAIAHRAEALRA